MNESRLARRRAGVALLGLAASMPLRDYAPRPSIRRPLTDVALPAIPAVDVHNHLGRWLTKDGRWMAPDVGEFIAAMDEVGLAAMVNLDGRWGKDLDKNIARYDAAHPGRFATFAHLNWARLLEDHPDHALVDDLRRARDQGARGVKVWKNLGLAVTDAKGDRVLPDDERLADAFAAAGELNLPILIHVGDPLAFFAPLDRFNERLDELSKRPDWWFGGPENPSFDLILQALATVVRRAPGTTFIGAHVGCAAEDLDWVGALMDECPNFHADLAGRLAELGRQPRRFRKLAERHPDRIIFGTDAYPLDANVVRTYWRFLHTDDECFPYYPGAEVPPQGRWEISGADLPAELLPAILAGNARRLVRF